MSSLEASSPSLTLPLQVKGYIFMFLFQVANLLHGSLCKKWGKPIWDGEDTWIAGLAQGMVSDRGLETNCFASAGEKPGEQMAQSFFALLLLPSE